MKTLRRYHRSGDICFITNVTYERSPILIKHIELFWKSFNNTRLKTPFELIAWVIFPDHYHLIVDPGEEGISSLMQRMKMSFAASYRLAHGMRSGRVWQNRFWDHIIRDDGDLQRHVDYIHFNPVKHGLVKSPFEWKHSSVFQFYPEEDCHFDLRLAESFKGEEFGE